MGSAVHKAIKARLLSGVCATLRVDPKWSRMSGTYSGFIWKRFVQLWDHSRPVYPIITAVCGCRLASDGQTTEASQQVPLIRRPCAPIFHLVCTQNCPSFLHFNLWLSPAFTTLWFIQPALGTVLGEFTGVSHLYSQPEGAVYCFNISVCQFWQLCPTHLMWKIMMVLHFLSSLYCLPSQTLVVPDQSPGHFCFHLKHTDMSDHLISNTMITNKSSQLSVDSMHSK